MVCYKHTEENRNMGMDMYIDRVRRDPTDKQIILEREHFCYTSSGELIAKLASTFVCSICGRDEFYREPFCHCGAKMDEEDEA